MQQYVKYSPLCKNEGNKETYLRKKHWKKKQKNVNYKDKEQQVAWEQRWEIRVVSVDVVGYCDF